MELILEIEEEFGVRIPDADAERIHTVGELWDLLMANRPVVPADGCATAAAFYRLRRGVMNLAATERQSLRPTSDLCALFPHESRRKDWDRLAQNVGLQLPPLEMPWFVGQSIGWTALVVGLSAGALIWNDAGLPTAAFVGAATFIVAVVLMTCMALPWRTALDPAVATLGELSRVVVGLNPDAWKPGQRQSPEVLWERLRTIIATQLGVSLDRVTREASFVNDLGYE